MRQKYVLLGLRFTWAAIVASFATVAWCAEDSGEPGLLPSKLPSAQSGVSPGQAVRAMATAARLEQEKLTSNPEIGRGPAAAVYERVAPATVLIHTGDSYGTGFLVSADGWILTNDHVAAEGGILTDSGVRVVKVYLGRLQGRIMEVQDTGHMGLVYKTNPDKDLALIKLAKMPQGVTKLPFIPLADAVPSPGSDCVAVGHPRAGMMWTVRGGEISAMGVWPQDMIQTVVARLTASRTEQEWLGRVLQATPRRKVLVSTCGVNPGDSGGPLVDSEGKLIGVTFGIPRNSRDEGISVDKFSYHLHLDEVRTFLADRPSQPQPFVPDPWPPGLVSSLADRTRDKILDTLLFAMRGDLPPTGCLVDLDQNSTPDFDPKRLDQPGMREAWDFEFAYHQAPVLHTFYDTDNDGAIDLILTDFNTDEKADLMLVRRDGAWEARQVSKQPMFDPSLFRDKEIGAVLAKILSRKPLSAAPSPAPARPKQ